MFDSLCLCETLEEYYCNNTIRSEVEGVDDVDKDKVIKQ